MDSCDVLVIGAGISGLGFANWWREREPNARVIVCEADTEVGGYCKTIVKDGFVWDYSGHFFHFRNKLLEDYLVRRMGADAILKVTKVTKIFWKDTWVDFPFQKNIHQLPRADFINC